MSQPFVWLQRSSETKKKSKLHCILSDLFLQVKRERSEFKLRQKDLEYGKAFQ